MQTRRENVDRIHEGARGIEHGDALQHSTNTQENEINGKPDGHQPEMPGDQFGIGPFPIEHAWHHEIYRAEHDHRKEAVQT
jgi:hypothetical protein